MIDQAAMFKKLCFHGVLNERTGYGIHGSRFVEALEKYIPVDRTGKEGNVHLTLVDVVSIQNIQERLPYPSICYSVWESTEYPSWFIEKLKLFDQLWVPSEWQRACSIAQGIPEEFVKVVPEGVDPNIYKPWVREVGTLQPEWDSGIFTFVHVGQWQPRKSTLEIIQAFLRAFPDNPQVRLQLSVDTLFPSDTYKSTEERLAHYGINDPRISVIHFEEREAYIRRLQSAHCFVSCARSEGWGLPICFPPETKVVMPSGIKNIADVCHGELVFSHTGEQRKVITTMKRKYCGDLSEIHIYGDYAPIKCTPEHPVLVIKRPAKKYKKSRFTEIDKITPEWIEAKDIKVGDAIIRSIPLGGHSPDIMVDLATLDTRLKKDENYVWYPTGYNSKGEQGKYNRYISLCNMGFLFGWYIAEGSNNCGAAVEFSLNSKEEMIAQEILRQCSLYFNAKGSYSIKENRLILRISSTILSKFFVEYCGKGAENKKIPNEVLYGDISTLKDLIVSYSDGDGHKLKNIITLSTVSELLSRQLGIALLRMGYKSNIQNNGKRNGNFDQYAVSWTLNRDNNIHSNKSWWCRYGIASLVKKTGSVSYDGYVYNLEVERDNSYRLVNASVHNCEAMACGIPSIAADFGGSTEYAMEAVNVRISKLIKPFGIYGNWDVPGMWAEPDYDHLVECMQDVYANYSSHKEKALKASDFIRTKFSWDAAAVKAMKIINDIPATIPGADPVSTANPSSPEESIRRYARELGYNIDTMHPRKAIFTIDTHPTSQAKMDTLVETIKQIKAHNLPLLVTSHVPLPAPIIEMVDYYIYDKRDILSGDDLPTYWRRHPDGKQETTKAKIPCHALAGLHNIRNAIDFCLGKYDWVYSMTYDAEVDLAEWFKTVYASDKDMILIKYENRDDGVDTKLMAGKTSAFDKILDRFDTWEQYASYFKEARFCSEKKYHEIVRDRIGLDNVDFITMDVGNRFDQVDRDAWPDDMFTCHFIDGPFLQIDGISNREYDVAFGNPINGDRFFHLAQKVGTWGRPSIKYYRDWTIKAVLTENGTSRVAFEHHMDLKDKRVLVSLGSKALGDTLAWMPYVEEFRKKHNCHVICSTWWNTILDYPEIELVEPGSQVANIYATYEVGCYDEQPDKNPANWRTVPLQKVAADILGIDYEPIRCKLKKNKVASLVHQKPYICFSEFSTMQNKFWNNPGAWQKTIDYLVSLGYECISISSEPSQLKNITKHNGQSIDDTIRDIAGADFYVGLNHGPSWIAYSLGIPFIMITGVSEEWNDVPNPYRIAINNEVCGIGCFNDPSLPINRGWEWCPRGKNYACTREITPEMVAQTIDRLMADYGLTENGKEEDNATEKGIVG